MRRAFLVCGLTLVMCLAVHAQQVSVPDTGRLSDALQRLQSSNLRAREVAFQDLMEIVAAGSGPADPNNVAGPLAAFLASHPQDADRVKVGLIRLLSIENETFLGKNVAPGTYTEADTEHFAQVIDVVSSIDDARALPALVGAMSTGGMAAGGVVKYG